MIQYHFINDQKGYYLIEPDKASSGVFSGLKKTRTKRQNILKFTKLLKRNTIEQ